MTQSVSIFAIALGVIGLFFVVGGSVAALYLLVNWKSGERCPKCNVAIGADAQECPACGVVIARPPVKHVA